MVTFAAPSRPSLRRVNSAPLLPSMVRPLRALPPPPTPAPLRSLVTPRPPESGTGRVSNWIVSTIVKEVSFNNQARSSPEAISQTIPDNIPMGLRITERTLAPTDPRIVHSAARRAQASAAWTEISGVVELGTGMMATYPMPPVFQVSTGFTTSGLLRYRTVLPFAQASSKVLNLPFTAQAAQSLPAGVEIEVAGQGVLSGWVNTTTFAGQVLGPAILGAGIATTHTGGLLQEYSVTVSALGDGSKVRVIVQNINKASGGATARILAGINFGAGTLAPPNIGAGQLQYYVNQNGYQFFEQMVSSFTSLQLYASANTSNNRTDTMVYDFDLSKSSAARAYEQLVRLSAGPAQRLATTPGSGVEAGTLEERDSSYNADAGLQVLGQTLLVLSAASQETQSRFTDPVGHQLITRQSVYSKHFSNVFKGSRDISWEMVSMRLSEEGPSTPFCHFTYKKKNKFTVDSDVAQFLAFVKAMGAQTEGTPQTHLIDVPTLEKVFSNVSAVMTNIDVYFTEAGMQNIVGVTEEAAVQAYLRSAVEIDPSLAEMPITTGREILDNYLTMKSNMSFLSICGSSELSGLEREYWERTRRSLKKDAKVLQQAKEFAKKIKELTDTTSTHQLSKFLKHIGSLTGFKYMPAILALTKIATPAEKLIHVMSMSGGGVSIVCRDEGHLMMPAERMVRLRNAPTLAI